MNSIDLIKQRLAHASRVRLQAVADATGVSVHTLDKIVRGVTKNPGIQNVEPVRLFLESEPLASDEEAA